MNTNGKLYEPKSGASVICFGHPLLDMMANVDQSFLLKYEIQPGSVSLARPEQLPLFDHLLDGNLKVEYVPGGSAMNTARTFSWVRPDAHVSYIGALGKDRFSSILKMALSQANVEPLFEEHTTKPTGTCAGLVFQKERSLLANLGAAVELSLQHFKHPDVQRSIRDASLYYAEGFFLNTVSSPQGLLAVAQHSKQYGKIFCLNLSAPYISIAFRDHIAALMPFIDYIFGSEEDVLAYAAARWPQEFGTAQHADQDFYIRSAVSKISLIPSLTGKRTVIATRGAMSTIIACGERILEVEVAPIPENEIVDLNGAGDAFVGGFLAQLMTSIDNIDADHLIRSVSIGHKAAQNCIQHNGATLGGHPPAVEST
ncbi:unnamed protein product [Phytomonas sp. Hart1]|nr:unnamed protein product [Phytomonas sp. Hart1]|eukprot:CCW66443.1 unnamed protein product [Phytomonas sp. isolate Hart1]